MKQIRHSVFETNSSSSHSITLHIHNVNGKIIPDVIKCKPFWEISFDYRGKIADNISLVLAAIWKDEMKLPVSVSSYESDCVIDDFIEKEKTPDKILNIIEDYTDCDEIGEMYSKYLIEFTKTNAYQDIKSNIKQVFPSSKIEILDYLDTINKQKFDRDYARLQITGLGKVLEYIEYDSEYHSVNKEKFKFFLQYAADIMDSGSEIVEYCNY